MVNKKNRNLYNKIIKLREKHYKIEKETAEILSCFTEEELKIDLKASNSEDLQQTIQCYIQYGEDEDKIFDYLDKR